MKAGAYIDAHRHVWDAASVRYPWLAERPDLPHVASLESGRPGGIVLVEAGASLDEEEREFTSLSALAQTSPDLTRIVSALPSGHAWLERLQRRAEQHKSLAGVRITMEHRPSDALLLQRGVEAATSCGLALDILAGPQDLLSIASATMEGAPTVVIDHAGNPPLRHSLRSAEGRRWHESIAALGERPNVLMKLSGLAPLADPNLPLAAQTAGYLYDILEQFPTNRLMIGSDWPVSSGRPELSAPGDWAALVKVILGTAFDEDLAWRTAARTYRFGVSAGA